LVSGHQIRPTVSKEDTVVALSLQKILNEREGPAAHQLVDVLDNGKLQCHACAHRCKIPPGREGICRVRRNVDGELRVPRGYVAGIQVDPIEKKPFFHVLPGNDALSFGMLGCDLHCSYCQNWVTSQALRDPVAGALPQDVTPAQLIDLAVRETAPVMVSTYNEPLITAEWAAEVFAPATARGLLCGFVSNGNATERVLDFLKPWIRVYKIDLKSFDDKHYRSLGAPLDHILEGVRMVHARFHLEIVSLLIPGFNDSDDELRRMAHFLRELSPDIPWHVTGYHEDYKMGGNGDTPASTLVRAAEIGVAEGLNFVYAGNRPGEVGEWENTRCPGCRATLIRRWSFRVLENRIGADGRCPDCARPIPGIWDHPLRRDRPASASAIPRRIR
jgi:pyruvate formate lyase activating enzyme